MRIVTFNAWVGQTHKSLTNNVLQLVGDLHAPEVLALQEVPGWREPIPGYLRVVCKHPSHRDNSSTQLLVRRQGVNLRGHRCVHVDGPDWRGPHGVTHPPRVFPAARIALADGRYRRILGVHRVPTPGRNAAAWDAEHAAIIEWVRARKLPVIMAGDWNTGPTMLAPLARQTNTATKLRGVDGFLISNTISGATVRRLPDHYGSDAHRPTILTIRETP